MVAGSGTITMYSCGDVRLESVGVMIWNMERLIPLHVCADVEHCAVVNHPNAML